MSAASPHIGQPTRARAESLGARWERLLAVASVCLPIPLLAATGLSIPLPSSVERIGAALVAWVDDAPESAPLPASGDIVLTDARQATPEREQFAPAARAAAAQAVAVPAPDGTSSPKTGGGKGSNGGGKGSDGGSTGSTGSGGSSPPATGGGTAPPPQPGPVEGTVNEVTKATQPVVDVVEDTVGGVDKTVNDLTDDLLGGGGLLGSGK